MPITLELIENNHILWFKVEGDWKPEEIIPAKEKTRQIFQAATQRVHSLLDLRKASVNMSLITASQQIIGGEPLPNAGNIAVVGVPWMMRMLVEPILRIANSGDPIRFFDNFEDAKKHLLRLS